MLEGGIRGAFQNVMINIDDIDDQQFCSQVLEEAEAIVAHAEDACAEVFELSTHR